MANLASTYWEQGRWDEAEKVFIEVMKARQERLGSQHPHTLTSIANLALTYKKQGRLDECIDLLSQAVQLMEVRMGPQHPTTIYFREQL